MPVTESTGDIVSQRSVVLRWEREGVATEANQYVADLIKRGKTRAQAFDLAAEKFPVQNPVERMTGKRAAFEDERQHVARLDAIAEGRQATKAAIANWAFANMSTPLSEIDPDEIPAQGAASFLQWARSSSGRDVFYTSYTRGVLQASAANDAQERYSDTGTPDQQLVEKTIAAFERQAARDAGIDPRLKEQQARKAARAERGLRVVGVFEGGQSFVEFTTDPDRPTDFPVEWEHDREGLAVVTTGGGQTHLTTLMQVREGARAKVTLPENYDAET